MNKVLIVEDDKLVSILYRKRLEEAGFAVEVVHDGQDGFYRIHEQRFTAVILDLVLPQINGLEILKKIRAQKQFEQLPVLVLTNSFLQDIGKEAQKLGAARVLDKAAATPRVLVEELKQTLEASAEKAKAAATEAEARQEIEREIPALRPAFQQLSRSGDTSARQQALLQLATLSQKVTGHAATTGMRRTAHLASALEALVQQLHGKPTDVNPSSLRTIASALDLLPNLANAEISAHQLAERTFTIMVVDDDPVSRRAVRLALEKINLPSITVPDPETALKLAAENAFDLIFLDVQMPERSGFDLCRDLRATSLNKQIPILFLTGLTDFESRAASAMSGGTDLIGKPFITMELSLKALTYLYGRDLSAVK